MRMKEIKLIHATAQFCGRILAVQLPMATMAGLRTR
jgi:hypothetical protein